MSRQTIMSAVWIVLFIGLLAGCGSGGEDSEVQSGGQPDLQVSAGYIMEGATTGSCVAQYGQLVLTVCVRNEGTGDAGPFAVADPTNLDARWELMGLAAGDESCALNPTDFAAGAQADPDNAIVELDEENNMTMAPIPTPPVLCTPTP